MVAAHEKNLSHVCRLQVMNKKRKKEKQEVKQEKPAKWSLSQSVSSTVVLPQEVLYEILTRVSLDHLLSQCRLVCKGWWRLTYESDFKLIHSQRTPTISGYLVRIQSDLSKPHFNFISFINQSPPIPSPFLDFLSTGNDVMIVSSSSTPHGLLSFVRYTKYRKPYFYVCKPASGQWRNIPKPPNYRQYQTLKFDILVERSNPFHYKIIHVWRLPNRGYSCEIFDSNNWRWQMLDDTVGSELMPRPACLAPAEHPGVLVHGAVHWLSLDHAQICALDVNIDGGASWKVIESPKDEQLREMYVNDFRVVKKVVECEGEIGLLYLSNGNRWLELWVLENYYSNDDKTRRWNKIYRVNLEPVYQRESVEYSTILDLYTKNVVLMKIGRKIIWYNCKTGTYTVALELPAGKWVHEHVHPIHSDLVPCMFMNRKGYAPTLESCAPALNTFQHFRSEGSITNLLPLWFVISLFWENSIPGKEYGSRFKGWTATRIKNGSTAPPCRAGTRT
ncbi:F-box domain [Macleaya cordata]|uniref:F-box domain n=1 Tax=Macleaya cordata TaxID=56857 RepID=A0A200PTW2_MACCD|nr:F-box domain [Macleaya cordata]